MIARLAFLGLIVAGLCAGASGPLRSVAATSQGPVYVVPIEGVVDEGMAHYVSSAVDAATADRASALAMEINTPGGLVDAAFEIRDSILGASIPTVAYVQERAYSAGALIALSAGRIVMAPGASIGAAEPIPNDPKHVSALRAEFAATAKRNHRDPLVAAAMVDKNVDLPAYKRRGAILSLTADEAVRAQVADAIAPTLADALRDAHLPAAPLVQARYTLGERIARFATSPQASSLLLSLGMLGLLIEMQTLHGIAGLIGVGALGLFFGTHVYAGFSDPFVIALAVAGLIGIAFELHVFPGHGFAGALGVLALAAAVVLAFGLPFIVVGVQAAAFAVVLSAIVFAVSTRLMPENAFFRRIAFTVTQGPDYVAAQDRRMLLGRLGVAASYLRPAGVANVDGRRVDVLTDGDFLPAGTPIQVSRVEGARVFVHRAAQES